MTVYYPGMAGAFGAVSVIVVAEVAGLPDQLAYALAVVVAVAAMVAWLAAPIPNDNRPSPD